MVAYDNWQETRTLEELERIKSVDHNVWNYKVVTPLVFWWCIKHFKILKLKCKSYVVTLLVVVHLS